MLQYGLSGSEWKLPDVQKLVRSGYSPPADHAPPLFVHANLLKYSAGLGEWFPKDTYSTWYLASTAIATTYLTLAPDRIPSRQHLRDDQDYNV